MKKNTDIWYELNGLSEVVAGIADVNPYTVPAGYFEGLPDVILNRIKAETEEIVPSFAANENPYQVPVGYFEGFAAGVMNKIKQSATESASAELETLSPLLNSISRKNPHSVPDGYFEDAATRFFTAAENSEVELSPILKSVQSVQVFTVAENYFEQFPGTVLNKIKTKQPARVISMGSRNKWMRYAAAAVIIGAVAIGGMYIFNHRNSAVGSIADVPKMEEQVADSLQQTSEKDIDVYLDNHDVAMLDNKADVSSGELNAKDADEIFSDVSDDALQQYLDDNEIKKDVQTN